jgi:hypothetical protein
MWHTRINTYLNFMIEGIEISPQWGLAYFIAESGYQNFSPMGFQIKFIL